MSTEADVSVMSSVSTSLNPGMHATLFLPQTAASMAKALRRSRSGGVVVQRGPGFPNPPQPPLPDTPLSRRLVAAGSAVTSVRRRRRLRDADGSMHKAASTSTLHRRAVPSQTAGKDTDESQAGGLRVAQPTLLPPSSPPVSARRSGTHQARRSSQPDRTSGEPHVDTESVGAGENDNGRAPAEERKLLTPLRRVGDGGRCRRRSAGPRSGLGDDLQGGRPPFARPLSALPRLSRPTTPAATPQAQELAVPMLVGELPHAASPRGSLRPSTTVPTITLSRRFQPLNHLVEEWTGQPQSRQPVGRVGRVRVHYVEQHQAVLDEFGDVTSVARNVAELIEDPVPQPNSNPLRIYLPKSAKAGETVRGE